MNFYLATCAALLVLFAAASCAPAAPSLHDACAAVRNSSLELNHIARAVSTEARSKDLVDFSTSFDWIEAKDMCDPGTLRHKPLPCIGKLLTLLVSYRSTLERLGGFQSCSAFASKVKPVMHKLHEDMSRCVSSMGGNPHRGSHISEEGTGPSARWQEPLLCHYSMDRLFSFSILTARVFAVGDPTHHTEGTTQRCM